MKAAHRERLAEALTPRLTPYIPHVPTPKQHAGLILPQREGLYGGAAGGGKSDWLLMGGLQYVDVPGYACLLLRRTFKELELEGGLLERAWEWLAPTDAVPHDGGMKWTFGDHHSLEDGGKAAVLQFGYMDGPNDHLRYQGSNWQYIGCDEATHLRMKQYRYMFSRLRRPDLTDETPSWKRALIEGLNRVPLRMRAASNPGGPSHEDFKNRFGIYRPEGEEKLPRLCHRPAWVRERNRFYLPAKLEDNPHLDQDAYDASLRELDPVAYGQLRDGDWDVREPGEMFRREWFEFVDAAPEGCRWLRYWDLAATEPSARNPDPDYTVGLKLGKHPNGAWFIADVVRGRWRSDRVEKRAQAAANGDGREVSIRLEQEPGASGKAEVLHWQRDVLPGHDVKGHAPADSKAVRARVVAGKCEAGLVKLVRGDWNTAFLDEAEAFPPEEGFGHDDQVDALSGAFASLESAPTVSRESYMERQTKVVQRGDLKLRGDQYVDKEPR